MVTTMMSRCHLTGNGDSYRHQKELWAMGNTWLPLSILRSSYVLLFWQKWGVNQKVEWRTVSDLFIIKRGKVISKDYIKDNIGEYPVYSSQTENDGVLGKISTYDF